MIRSGGPQSEWVMKELEFRGLITHVLDESTPSRFVQNLMERFRADREADHFEADFEKRLQGVARSKPNSQNSGLKRVLHTTGQATEADGLKGSTMNRKWPLATIFTVLIVMALAFNLGWFESKVGRFPKPHWASDYRETTRT